MDNRIKILICGVLPPPSFGHSMMYKILMDSSFIEYYDVKFLNMRFWSYTQHKKVTFVKMLKLIQYFICYVFFLLRMRPRYILYNMSFDKMPFLKDFLFCYIGKLMGGRIILHDMGQYVRELYESGGKFHKHLMKWLLKNVHGSIILGGGTKSAYKGFLDEKRLFVVPGSVEDSVHISPATSAKNKRNYVDVLYFSFLSESKGILTAFKAASKILDTTAAIYFSFAGPVQSGAIQKELDALLNKYGGRVRYLGYIEDMNYRTTIFRDSDIFIFPTHRDVFGLVLLHAMAERLPIIASQEGCISEIIKEGENGFLIKKGDDAQLAEKILLLADDEKLRESMGKANRERYVRFYSPDVYARRMRDVFGEIECLDGEVEHPLLEN